MLTMIGLGLTDEKDITVKGLAAVRAADKVFLEAYTSLLQCSREDLARFYDKQIEVLGRMGVEQQAEVILDAAASGDAAFLVVGDVFSATTHHDLFLRADERGIPVRVIHNASIMNAIAQTGLDLYRFGRTTTLVYPEGNYRPTSFYDFITENKERGLHTLCLLDIKAEKGRFMTVPEACAQLLEIAQEKGGLDADTEAVGVARLGAGDQQVRTGTLETLQEHDWGGPPHSLVVPGRLSDIERDMLARWD